MVQGESTRIRLGRPDVGELVKPKERPRYELSLKPENENRVLVLPGVLMLLVIIGLGGGVWVVRRR